MKGVGVLVVLKTDVGLMVGGALSSGSPGEHAASMLITKSSQRYFGVLLKLDFFWYVL